VATGTQAVSRIQIYSTNIYKQRGACTTVLTNSTWLKYLSTYSATVNEKPTYYSITP